MTTSGAAPGTNAPLAQVAMDKLVRVFGSARANRMFAEVLEGAGLAEISTPNDLYLFGEHLSGKGGFGAAVGRLIAIAATLRGADGKV